MPPDCPNDLALGEFVVGGLPPHQSTNVSEHLRTCPRCTARLRALESGTPPTEVVLLRATRVRATPATSDPEFVAAVARLLRDPPVGHALEVGDTIDGYRLIERIGEGGMGVVFRAVHTQLDKEVALKIIRGSRALDPQMADRFRREMRAAGKLDHPNLVRATDAGVTDGVQYLVMDYCPGTNLARLVTHDGPVPRDRACELVRQAALGLHHAHQHGLVHRDVKPSNLLLGTDGIVRVLDLGLARLPDEPPPESHSPPPADATGTADDTLTTPGQQLGTRDYTAPEQVLDSHRVDQRADVYGLGCTLVYLLTGHSYIPGEPLPPDPPPDVWTKLLAANPDERFPTALAAAEALGAICAPPLPPEPKLRGWVVPAALVATVAAAVSAALALNQPSPGGSSDPIPVLSRNEPLRALDPSGRAVAPPPRAVPPRGSLPMTADEARALQKRWADHIRQPVSVTNSLGMELVLIPPGEFGMSATYRVTLTKPYRIATTEVTFAQFQKFVAANPGFKTDAEAGRTKSTYFNPHPLHQFPNGKGKTFHRLAPGWGAYANPQPITYLTWNDADAFLNWLSASEGRRYRLPTYAEWSWACRAGSGARFYWGSEARDLPKYAWCALSVPRPDRPQPVGQLPPNNWGLHDMLGNAMEMVQDYYRMPLPAGHMIDPLDAVPGPDRILCGGAYWSLADFARDILPASVGGSDRTNSSYGFRVVLEP